MWRCSSDCAAATLASTMNSSISLWLSSRSRTPISAMRPSSPSLTSRSGRSRSSAPRFSRAARSVAKAP